MIRRLAYLVACGVRLVLDTAGDKPDLPSDYVPVTWR